jgi:hypothetical protein
LVGSTDRLGRRHPRRYLLVWGDDTVDRVFGIGLVAMPALLALMSIGVWAYVLWSLVRERARHS